MDLGSVTVSEALKNSQTETDKNIPGFRVHSTQPSNIFPEVRLFIPVEFGRGTEFVRYQCHRIRV